MRNDHPFESPRQLLAHAKERIVDLELKVKQFFELNPCTRVVEKHPNGIHEAHKFRLAKYVPASITTIAAEAINSLRSVLDHAGYAAAVASGKIKPRHAYFPFGTDADFQRSGKGNSKDVPPDVVSVMRSFKPYKTGNDLLWALNQARCANTHAILTATGITTDGGHIRQMTIGQGGHVDFKFPPVWDGAKNEITFGVFGADTQVEYDVDLAFDITFREVEVIKGQPVVRVLNAMANEIEGILMAIEAETRRLFPRAFE